MAGTCKHCGRSCREGLDEHVFGCEGLVAPQERIATLEAEVEFYKHAHEKSEELLNRQIGHTREAEARSARLAGALQRCEWAGYVNDSYCVTSGCPACGIFAEDANEGHEAGCWMRAALADTPTGWVPLSPEAVEAVRSLAAGTTRLLDSISYRSGGWNHWTEEVNHAINTLRAVPGLLNKED